MDDATSYCKPNMVFKRHMMLASYPCPGAATRRPIASRSAVHVEASAVYLIGLMVTSQFIFNQLPVVASPCAVKVCARCRAAQRGVDRHVACPQA